MLKFLSSSPTLGDLAVGKDNNFNLLRLLAAFAVLISHSFAMLGQPEPFAASVGKNLGAMAVDVFFIASGFLVGASLIRTQDVGDYLRARVLRIFPALWVMLLLTVFVLGAIFTRFESTTYLNEPQTWRYLWKNFVLMSGVEFYLPGLFESNRLRGVVNGSLWSMIYELSMYVLLLSSWIVYAYARKVLSASLALIAGLGGLAIGLWITDRFYVLEHKQLLRFAWFFFVGTSFYLLRHQIRMSAKLMGIIAALAMIALAISGHHFLMLYYLALPYCLFYFAYIPAGKLRSYNRFGDYSYGVYLYAFPIQQALVLSAPDWSVFGLIFTAGSLTFILAICSWHWLEQPALQLRKRFL
ncbi:acyltransferase [Undibacterium amnicola]|uniref:Acyltransferase n=1 Tax=Undibacterium amnicola TaxID=1834038 RepID=A0ABR6XRP7_9BURK|nr:acyltransferase [Undibacterium amnicola]